MFIDIVKLKNILLSTVICVLLSLNAKAADISAIDFSGTLIGKVIPDGSVVNYNNELVGKITADGFVIDDNNVIIGGLIPQGIAISYDNNVLGKVNNDGTVTSSNNTIEGKILPNGLVVNDKDDVIGSVISPGLVYNDEGKIVGRVSGDGSFYNLSGVKSGYVTSSGYVYKVSSVDNSKELIGKLISSKTVVSTTGKFLGSVSPDGKVIDLSKRVIGIVHANGYVYDDNNSIIGMLVKDEYAFTPEGNFLGIVSYNGEVINKDKTIGYSVYGNRVINKENSVIGFTVKVNATANSLNGKYLGQIDINGSIVKGNTSVGKIISSDKVVDNNGEVIGLINHVGPIFNYLGKNNAFATINGRVISLDGVDLGYTKGKVAFDNKDNEIGRALDGKVNFDLTNNFIGLNGVNSILKHNNKIYTVTPYGYVFDGKGNIAGGNYELSNIITSKGDILTYTSVTGKTEEQSLRDVTKLTLSGFFVDKNNKLLGQILNYDYVTNFMGKSLGLINQTNVIDKKSQIGKIVAGGDVLKSDSKKIDIIGKADTAVLSISINGDLIGFNNTNGTVVSNGEQIGRITSLSQVVDNSGAMYGKTLKYGNVVSNKCEFLGVISDRGDARKTNNSLLGTILANNQVINETQEIIGQVITPQSVIGKNGEVIGIQTSLGTVLNYKNENLGCQDLYGNIRNSQNEIIGVVNVLAPVMGFDNKIIGNTDFSGKVIDFDNKVIGNIGIDGGVYSNNHDDLGVLFKYSVAFNDDNVYVGRINKQGNVISDKGEIIGQVNHQGRVNLNNKQKGFALYDLYVYDNDGETAGYIAKNGRAYNIKGDIIGSIDKGFIVDKKENVQARGLRDYYIRDSKNKIVGYLNLNGDVVNTSNVVVGKIQENGDVLNSDGKLLGKANELQFYKKTLKSTKNKNTKKNKSKSNEMSDEDKTYEDYENDESVENTENNEEDIDYTEENEDSEDNEHSNNVSQAGKEKSKENNKKASETILKHKAVGIAITPGGKYIGDIYDNGYVIGSDGKIVAREEKNGVIVDNENNEIGIRAEQEVKDVKIDEKRLRQSNQGVTINPYSDSFDPTNVGPGGGIGEGGRYNPRRAAIISNMQNTRRMSLSGKKIQSSVNGEAYTGWQNDWGFSKTTISTLRVDMSNMITGDKPIPAVLARSIVSLGSAPVTAIVERNVYADSGRNVIIPAGSRIIGGMDDGADISSEGRFNGESGGVKLDISWDRIIRPDGIAFSLDANQTADAQGRGGGALGYIDEQIIKKYGMPLVSTVATSAVAYMMAANEDETGNVENSKQQAAADARQEFLSKMDEIIGDIMDKKSQIEPVTFVPAGTRIIIYPLSDLWLRTTKDILEGRETINREVEDVLVTNDGNNTNRNQNVTVQNGQNTNQPVPQERPLIVENSNANNQRNTRVSVGSIPPPAADGTISHNPYSEEDSGDIELEF